MSWFVLAAPVLAATGPFAVAHADRRWDDPVAHRVDARVYFPADATGAPDPSAGPFPMAVFLHGWLGQAWMYDTVCESLASEGFVVVSLDTETGLILDMEALADDGVAALHAVEAASADRGDPLAGLVSRGDLVALGHSMGGATLAHLLALEPRIRTAVAFMPYEGHRSYYPELGAFDGAYLLLSGTHDTTAPVRLQRDWFTAAERTRRSLWVTVTDMGHQAVTDLSFDEDPMPDDQQLEFVTRLSTAFVLAEHDGDEDRWADLVGPGTDDVDAAFASRSHAPAVWATLDADVASLGVAALPGATGEVFFGSAPSADGLEDAVLAGAVDLSTGVGRATVPVPAGWTGDLYVRVRTDGDDGVAWTRAVPLATGAPGEEPPTDATDPEPAGPARATVGIRPAGAASVPRDRSSTPPSGCSTSGARGGGTLVLLLALRRRAP